MRLATRLKLYLLALHLIVAGVLFTAYLYASDPRPGGWIVLAVEIVLALSLWLGWRWVSALGAPAQLVDLGVDLIEERDFGSTFRTVGQPEMDRLIGVYNRMIHELRSERLRAREQQAFLEQLVRASPTGILICDLDGDLVELNPSARRLFESAAEGSLRQMSKGSAGTVGRPILGNSVSSLPEPWGSTLPALASGRSVRVALSDGRQIRCRAAELMDRGFPRRFFLLDELTEELRRNERGAHEKLIRLVSHEVNNSVGAVTSLLDSLALLAHGSGARGLDASDRPAFERAVGVASDRLERLRAFVDGYAQVVRLPEPVLRPFDLRELARDLVTLLRPSFAERGLYLELAGEGAGATSTGEPLPIEADRAQLEQVLVNVLENGAEATAERLDAGPGGERPGITLTLDRDSDGWPRLRVDDEGPGVDPAEVSQLFTPFFTTRLQGSGLGLAMVKEILLRHGFDFSLEPRFSGATRASEEAHAPEMAGARFTIRFHPS
ncbi:MAG: ATP-binding protein [Holophagales bacterium]|nr:ATP-binding protein [Holophagales bacterium]